MNKSHPRQSSASKENKSTSTPIIRQAGEGEQRWFAGGGVLTMKATSQETNGAFVLFEDNVTHGKVTPLHTHPKEDETMYILEGEILLHVDGKEYTVGTHGVAVIHRNIPHAFMVISKTARILFLQTPGSGEMFYREASDPVTSDADSSKEPDLIRLRKVAEQSTSIVLLGPPPFKIS